MTYEEIISALRQADDLGISEEVDCFDVLNYIEDLRNKNKALDAHNAISTLLDVTRKLLEQGSSKGGVWIKTGDLNDTYSILIQKESLGTPIAALNAKVDDLSVELGQAKAYKAARWLNLHVNAYCRLKQKLWMTLSRDWERLPLLLSQ